MMAGASRDCSSRAGKLFVISLCKGLGSFNGAIPSRPVYYHQGSFIFTTMSAVHATM